MLPKYIFFDWHKTLSEDIFWPEDKNISDVIFNDNSELLNKWMKGEKSSEDISEIIHKKTGVDQSNIYEKLEKGCREMSFALKGVEDYILKIKKRGIKVGIATDNMDAFLRFTIPSLKLNEIFDEILVSSEIGFLKGEVDGKNIKFFEKFIFDNNISYSDLVLVDDSKKIYELYKPFGLQVLRVKNPASLKNVISGFI